MPEYLWYVIIGAIAAVFGILICFVSGVSHRKKNADSNMVYIAQQRPIQGLYARYCCGVIRRQYIPHIVRSLNLWCQQPVLQTDSRSMRLRTPV